MHDQSNISQIIVQIKLSQEKYVYVAGIYRQWNLPAVMRTDPSKCGLPAQLDRLYRAVKMIKASYNSNYPIIWAGDINIYQWAPNNPLARPDIKLYNYILAIS